MYGKRRIRGPVGSSGANFTPKQAKEVLTLPIYALITGHAQAEFPGSNLASPSQVVTIAPTLPVGFPSNRSLGAFQRCVINGKQWNTAVVPILQSPNWSSGTVLGLGNTSNSYFLDALGNAIAESFSNAGYGPVDR